MQQTIEQPHSRGLTVIRSYPHEDQESGAYGCNALVADFDAGLRNAL
jgi:hypothetical protein